ncbi:MAG: hypothetical protein PHQ32_04120 [Firmicutes bacterium]|nr:hypothetical protein [Bacillota bacterium]
MLGKLIKYEFKSTMRIFLPIYGVIIGFSLIQVLLDLFNIKMIFSDGILVTTYVLLIIGTLVLTLIVGIQRFFKNILGTEGYLMNTLPVKSWKLIFSKLFTSVSWFFGTVLITLSALSIQLASRGMLQDTWENIELLWNSLMLQYSWNSGLLIGKIVMMIVIYACYGFLMVYCAMAIGHLFNSNRIISSFIAYIGLYFIVQVISVVVLVGYAFVFGGGIDFLTNSNPDVAFTLINNQMIEMGLLAVIYYLVTNYIVKKRLNLE